MVKITDRQLDMALRMASQYCYEEDIKMMKAVDPKDYPTSEKSRKRFEKTLKRSERRERWHELGLVFPKPIKKAAIIVLVIGTLLFTGMMTIQPVRAAIVDVIIRWYDRYIGVLFTAEDTVPTEIQEIVLPKNLPDGWEINQLSVNLISAEHIIKTKEGENFRLTQVVIGKGEQWLDNEEVTIKKVSISDEIEGIFYIYPDRVTLVWQEQYVYLLRGGVSSFDLLLQIAKEMVSA